MASQLGDLRDEVGERPRYGLWLASGMGGIAVTFSSKLPRSKLAESTTASFVAQARGGDKVYRAPHLQPSCCYKPGPPRELALLATGPRNGGVALEKKFESTWAR